MSFYPLTFAALSRAVESDYTATNLYDLAILHLDDARSRNDYNAVARIAELLCAIETPYTVDAVNWIMENDDRILLAFRILTGEPV